MGTIIFKLSHGGTVRATLAAVQDLRHQVADALGYQEAGRELRITARPAAANGSPKVLRTIERETTDDLQFDDEFPREFVAAYQRSPTGVDQVIRFADVGIEVEL